MLRVQFEMGARSAEAAKAPPPATRRDVALSQLFTFSPYGRPLHSDGLKTAESLVSAKGVRARWQTWCLHGPRGGHQKRRAPAPRH